MHIDQSDFHDQLMRGLAHKMNNILSLFHGYVGLLLDNKKLDPSLIDDLGKIEQGAQAASELMDRTKSLARPSSIIVRNIDVAEFLRGLKTTLQNEAGNGVKIKITWENDMPIMRTDGSRLKAAIVELVRNACDASKEKGTVQLKAYARANGRGAGANGQSHTMRRFFFDVTDSGPGIPTESVSRVFQPFFTTKHKQGAVGLGLTVAVGLIQQLGGMICFESQPGRTTFQISLPESE